MPEYISVTEAAGTMRWFQKKRRPEIWEIAEDRPFGDIEAAQRIREICASASAIAEAKTGTPAGGLRVPADKDADAERYQAAIKRALEISMKISDDQMRDVSVSLIIRLCVKVNHLKTARVLLRALRSQQEQAELMAENPVLRGS